MMYILHKNGHSIIGGDNMKRWILTTLAALIILSGGFILGLNYKTVDSADQNTTNISEEQNNDEDVSTNGGVTSNDTVVTSNECSVKYIITYLKAQESITKQEDIGEELTGKSEKEIKEYYGDEWNLDYFSADEIVLSKSVDGYPKGYAYVKVDLDDEDLSFGQTKIYEYDEEGELILKNTIDEVPQMISVDDMKELINGKVFDSLDEAYAYLENILE